MFDRRKEKRPGSRDRRRIPRPPLWINLTLLLIGVAVGGIAKLHRGSLDRRFGNALKMNEDSPLEVNRIKSDLAELDMTEEELARELEGRLRQLQSVRSSQFYISIDTSRRKFYLNYGGHILREADVQIGPPRTLRSADGKTWTFVPIRGAFQVSDKVEGLHWRIPEWVYALAGERAPRERPVVENGLGRYVIFLSSDYVIHSPPDEESPLKGPKPGSFLVPEADLRAIWPRVETGTTWIYIF